MPDVAFVQQKNLSNPSKTFSNYGHKWVNVRNCCYGSIILISFMVTCLLIIVLCASWALFACLLVACLPAIGKDIYFFIYCRGIRDPRE